MPPDIDLYDEVVRVKENYWEVGHANGYVYPQANKYVPSEHFKDVMSFGNDQYALSHVDRIDEIEKSHRKYAETCDLRDSKLLDRVVPLIEPVMWEIWGDALKAPMLRPCEVIGLQEMNKGSGLACSSLKGECWRASPGLAIETLQNPQLFDDQPCIWMCSGKLEVRDVAKDCRCYLIAPMWHSMLLQMFCKMQNVQIMEGRFELPSAVGMSVPYDWYDLRRRLYRYERSDFKIKFFLADIKLYDSQQYRKFFDVLASIRARGLNLGKRSRLRKSFDSLYAKIQSRFVILPNGKIVYTKDGNPSGSANTTMDNGMNSVAQLAVCWFVTHADSFVGFVEFIQRCAYLTFGDDLICSITCPEDELFFKRLPEVWQSIYGSIIKSEIVERWSDVHFLGAQPLGDVDPYIYLLKPYDIPRLVANLYYKGSSPKNFDPCVELQRALAHRQLLAPTALVSDHKLLDILVLCIKRFMKKHNASMRHNDTWKLLCDRVKLNHIDFLASTVGSQPLIDKSRPLLGGLPVVTPVAIAEHSNVRSMEVPIGIVIHNLIIFQLATLDFEFDPFEGSDDSDSDYTDEERPLLSCFVPTTVDAFASVKRSFRINNKDEMSLSYAQWCEKHTAKLADLSKAEKKKRYNDYLASSNASGPARKGALRSGFSGAGNSLVSGGTRSGNSANTGPGAQTPKKSYSMPALSSATAAYGMSLLNPGCDDCNGAKVVSMIDQDSGVINSKVVLSAGCPSVPDSSDANIPYDQTGSGAFIGRPGGLFMSYLYTPGQETLGWVNPEDQDPTESPGLVVFSPQNGGDVYMALNVGYGGTTENAPDTMLYPNQNPSNPCWMSLPDCQQIQMLSSKKRVVSAGVEVAYTGPPITGSGQIAVGLVPWDMFRSTEMSINDTGFKVYPAALSWEQFIQLEGVEVYPALGGCHKTWYPYDASGTDYQESIATYVESENTATGVNALSAGLVPKRSQIKESVVGSKVPRKLSAAGKSKYVRDSYDPRLDSRSVRRSKKVSKRNRSEKTESSDTYVALVDSKTGKVVSSVDTPSAPADVGADITSAFLVYDGYLGSGYGTAFPMDSDQQEMGAFLSATAMAGQFAAQAAGGEFSQQTMDEVGISAMETRPCQGQPLIVVMWNGVAPSNQEGLNPSWAANLFQITYYVNHEIIPDQNTFRIAEMPMSANVGPAAVGSPGVAIKAAKSLGPSGPGPLPKKESTWKKFTTWVKGAIGTGKKIAGYVGKAAEIAEGVGDVLAAFV